jgi:hypothetical protein
MPKPTRPKGRVLIRVTAAGAPSSSVAPKQERLSCWPLPSIAIDLPLKILIWEDREGKVWVSYNSPAYLLERHGLPKDLLQNIAVVETLAAAIAE